MMPVSCYRRRVHVAEKGLMRWYNPKIEGFEWRKVPASDKEALSLFEGYPSAEDHAEIYREWRALGANIKTALMRAGEAARNGENGEPLA
jgi:hypothetical protein